MNKYGNMLILTIFLVGQLILGPLSALTVSAATLEESVEQEIVEQLEMMDNEEVTEDDEELVDEQSMTPPEEEMIESEEVFEPIQKEEEIVVEPTPEQTSGTDPPQKEETEKVETVPEKQVPVETVEEDMTSSVTAATIETKSTNAKKPVDTIRLVPKKEPLNRGGVARVDIEWSITDGSYKPGDHFTIDLPADFAPPKNTLAGEYLVCTPTGHTLYCVFTEKVENKINVSGELWYETMYLPEKNSGQVEPKEEEGSFDFTSDGNIFTNNIQVVVPGDGTGATGQHQTHRDLQKFAGDVQWQYDQNNNKVLRWIVEINGNLKTNLGETTYVDRLGPGHEIVPESIKVNVVHSPDGPTGTNVVDAEHGGPLPNIELDADLKGFKVTFADQTLSGYRADIRYDTKITSEQVPKWVNQGDVSNNEYNAGSDAMYENTQSGAKDRGENKNPRTVKIVKAEGDVYGPGIKGVEFKIFNQQGKEVATTLYPTDHNGVATIWNPDKGEKLEPGVYYATEVLGTHNAKYDVDPNKRYYFVIEETKGTVLTVVNHLKDEVKTDIKVSKVWENDSVEHRPQAVSVQVFQNGQPFGEAHEVTASENWTKIVRGLPKYDAEGNTYQYSIEEVNVPEGYTSKVNGYTITNTYEEQKKNHEIELIKRDAKDETIVLAGAVFELFNEQDESQGTYTTNAEGKIVITDLPEGEYYFVEKKAPLGYKLSDEKHNVQNGKVTVTNEKVVEIEKTFTYAVHKIDAETKKPLQGVQFQLQTTDGDVVRTGETDAAGNLTFTKLPEGEYVFVEVAPLEGYQPLQAPVVAEDGKTVTIENKKEETPVKPEEPKPEVELTKVDSKNHDRVLSGAQFELYQVVDGKDVQVMNGEEKSFITGEDGKIIVKNLSVGTYYFLETKAPKGYQLNKEKQHFVISDKENVTKLTVENKKRSSGGGGGGTPPTTPEPVEPTEPTEPTEPEEEDKPEIVEPEQPEEEDKPVTVTPEDPKEEEENEEVQPSQPTTPNTPEEEERGEEVIQNEQKPANTNTVAKLPQTGEELYVVMKYVGLALMFIGLLFVVRQRKYE